MRCGISTACFYPQQTDEALARLADAGVQVAEIFINTFHELEDRYLAKLLDVMKAYKMDVPAVHPFSSAMEGFLFATEYKGRFQDGVQFYRRYFEACNILGANKLVFHGDHKWNEENFPLERYAKRFLALGAAAKEYGVTLCHENVSYCRLGASATVQELRPLLGGDAAFVLDTKQVQRAGSDVPTMLRAMEGAVQHIHISDYTDEYDCIPPGQGRLDFVWFLDALRSQGYEGDLIIELYRDGFGSISELVKAKEYIEQLIEKIPQ